MAIPQGLSFDENAHGFVLRRKSGARTTTIKISREELFGLQETISSWSDRMVSEVQARSGQVQAIAFQQIVDFGLAREALMHHLLLTLVGPSGARRTFGLPLAMARQLVQEIPSYLPQPESENPTKQ